MIWDLLLFSSWSPPTLVQHEMPPLSNGLRCQYCSTGCTKTMLEWSFQKISDLRRITRVSYNFSEISLTLSFDCLSIHFCLEPSPLLLWYSMPILRSYPSLFPYDSDEESKSHYVRRPEWATIHGPCPLRWAYVSNGPLRFFWKLLCADIRRIKGTTFCWHGVSGLIWHE